MAVRQPLYWDTGSGSIKTMTTGQVADIVNQAIYQYSLAPSVTLDVVASGGNLGTLSDTRKAAGGYLTNVSAYPDSSTTQEPGTVTVNFAKINQTVAVVAEPTSGAEGSYPIYYYNGGFRPMSNTDVYDTFINPAIAILTSGSTTTAQGGTYRIHTSNGGLLDHTLVSASPVFTDTRADTSLYAADSIPEDSDQPIDIGNFYLYKINGSTSVSYISPLKVTASNNDLQVFSTSLFDTLLQNHIRYAAAGVGTNIRYSYITGNNRGSGMTDTILDGDGLYQNLFVGADDYRSQEFPNGTPVTANTYFLKIN